MVHKTRILLYFLIKTTKELTYLFYITIIFLSFNSIANASSSLINFSSGQINTLPLNSSKRIIVEEGSTFYAHQGLKAAYIIQHSKKFTLKGLLIKGTLDGGNTKSASKATPAKPALLIDASISTTELLTITDSITIGEKALLTTTNASALKITVPIKGNIINNGTITANTCIEITRIIDGTLTNNGMIKANNNGLALKIETAGENLSKKSFTFINQGSIDGNLTFKAKNDGFNYNINNIQGYINTASMTLDNVELNITNNAKFQISNLALDSKANLNIKNNPNAVFEIDGKIENSGNLAIDSTVKLNKLINNKNAKVKISGFIDQKNFDIKNNGLLYLEASSTVKAYTGSGELVIDSKNELLDKSILLNVINNATFTKQSKIILSTSALYQPKVEITVVKAGNIKSEDDVAQNLYSILSLNSILLHISEATLENSSIKAKVERRNLSMFEMNAINSRFAKSLADEKIICAKYQKFKTDQEYKADFKNNKKYQNQRNIEGITLITNSINSILNDRRVSLSLAAIDVPRIENHKSISNNNKMIFSITNKQREKRKNWLKKYKNIIGANEETSVEFWLLFSYHVSLQKKNYDKPYEEWQDQSVCFATEASNRSISVGICYINTNSLINIKTTGIKMHPIIKNKIVNIQTINKIKMNSSSGLAYIVHDIGSLSNNYAFMYGRTEHKSDDEREDFYSKEYSAMLSTSYGIHWRLFSVDLGITSRFINIYTPVHDYRLSDISIGYSSHYYLSLGPVISFAIHGKLFENVYSSLELNTGYLRTSGINDKNEINIMVKSSPFMKIKQEYYVKDNIYAEIKFHLILNKLSFGVVANCNYDNNRLLYGGSGFISISF